VDARIGNGWSATRKLSRNGVLGSTGCKSFDTIGCAAMALLRKFAGLGLNSVASPRIYADFLAYCKFPDGLLTGRDERINALRALLASDVLNAALSYCTIRLTGWLATPPTVTTTG
jgi:hypothetical protein